MHELEQRVAELTAALEKAHEAWRTEIRERQRAEEAACVTEQRYHALLENSRDGIALVDSTGTIRLFASPLITRILGRGVDELIGHSGFELVHPDDLAGAQALLRELLKVPGREMSTRLRLRHKDGSWRWLDSICKNLLADPSVQAIVVNYRDITERVAKEQALRESEEFARNLIESSLDMIIAVDRDRTITAFNATAEKTFGYRRAEVLGESVDILYADPQEGRDVNQKTGEIGQYVEEVLNRRKNGEIFSSLLCASVLRDSRGELMGVMGISRDISVQQHNEQALKSATSQVTAVANAMTMFLERGNWRETSSQLLRAALEQTGSEYGFVGAVVEGPVLRVLAHEGMSWHEVTNREFYEQALDTYQRVGFLEFSNFQNLFGAVITGGQAVVANDPAKEPRSGGLPPGHPPLHSFLGVPITNGSEVVGMIGVANRPGGYTGQVQSQIEVLAHALAVLYESYRRHERALALEEERDRTLAALRASQEDLERRVRERTADLSRINACLEEQIRERQRAETQITEALQQKDALLREVYHRTKNNLQVIYSMLDLQAERVEDAKAREIFRDCQNRIYSMALVHEKLYQGKDLARIEVRGYVQDLVQSLFQTYGVGHGGIDVQLEVEDLVWGIDTAVPFGLMLNELVSNALKHAFSGGRSGVLRIQLRLLASRQFELVVSDNGVGLPERLGIHEAKSLGLKMINTLSTQLRGVVELHRHGGTEYRIRFQEIKYPQQH